MQALIEKYGLTFCGEEILPDVYSVVRAHGEIRVIFEDEYVAFIISGNCPCNVYNEFERRIDRLGYRIEDVDGAVLILSKK